MLQYQYVFSLLLSNIISTLLLRKNSFNSIHRLYLSTRALIGTNKGKIQYFTRKLHRIRTHDVNIAIERRNDNNKNQNNGTFRLTVHRVKLSCVYFFTHKKKQQKKKSHAKIHWLMSTMTSLFSNLNETYRYENQNGRNNFTLAY